MKSLITSLLILFTLASASLLAQGYFVGPIGDYLPESNFKTHSESNLQKYAGTYIAVSETYESAYTFTITPSENSLDILLIGGACMDGETWQYDTVSYKNISVANGKFTLADNPIDYGGSGNQRFRFAKVTYKYDGKTVNTEGILMEDYKMFAVIDN